MIGRRAWIGIAVVPLGLGVAACSSGSNSASPTTTKASSGSTATTAARTGGSNPNSAFCKGLAQQSATETTLSTGLSDAMKTNDLATIKTAFKTFLDATQVGLQKVTSAASSAPANVKAAFKTITDSYAQIKASVAGASSVAQIQSSLTSLTSAPAATSADTTISAYVTGQCGVAATSTSTTTTSTSLSTTSST
jgi:putative hemolysin